MVCLSVLLAMLPVVPAVRSEKITECKLPPEGYRIDIYRIRAVLAGHQHFEASSRLTPTLTEYLAGGNYCGECTEITFT